MQRFERRSHIHSNLILSPKSVLVKKLWRGYSASPQKLYDFELFRTQSEWCTAIDAIAHLGSTNLPDQNHHFDWQPER